jgi:hypothetical protein
VQAQSQLVVAQLLWLPTGFNNITYNVQNILLKYKLATAEDVLSLNTRFSPLQGGRQDSLEGMLMFFRS